MCWRRATRRAARSGPRSACLATTPSSSPTRSSSPRCRWRPRDEFLFSDNMRAVAKANGWWDGAEPFHFTRAFSIGEYTSHGYAARRMWAFWEVVAERQGARRIYRLDVIGGAYRNDGAPRHQRDPRRRPPPRLSQLLPGDQVRPLGGSGGRAVLDAVPFEARAGRGGGGGHVRSARAVLAVGAVHRVVPLDQHPRHLCAGGGRRHAVVCALRGHCRPSSCRSSPSAASVRERSPTPPTSESIARRRTGRSRSWRSTCTVGGASCATASPRWRRSLRRRATCRAANLLKQEERWSNARANAADAHAGAVVTVWQELYEELLMKFADGYAWRRPRHHLPRLPARGGSPRSAT